MHDAFPRASLHAETQLRHHSWCGSRNCRVSGERTTVKAHECLFQPPCLRRLNPTCLFFGHSFVCRDTNGSTFIMWCSGSSENPWALCGSRGNDGFVYAAHEENCSPSLPSVRSAPRSFILVHLDEDEICSFAPGLEIWNATRCRFRQHFQSRP
jgi:hypothetical protein